MALVKQEIRNHELKNITLEKEIDDQIDKQIEIK